MKRLEEEQILYSVFKRLPKYKRKNLYLRVLLLALILLSATTLLFAQKSAGAASGLPGSLHLSIG